MFALAIVPFLAACWSKKDKVETIATEVMAEPVVNPEQTEEMPGMADSVKTEVSEDELSDEK